jgi:thymidylate synthase
VLQIWDSRVDLPNAEGKESSQDIPCNVVSLLKVRNGALEWTQILRSNDIFRGQPYNFVQFTTLQEVIAGWLNLELGSYNQFSDSLHVYKNCDKYIDFSSQITVEENKDRLALPKEESDAAFTELARWAEQIAVHSISGEELAIRVDRSELPNAFRNMLCILIAEGARRRGQYEIGKEVMDTCTNPAYKQLWDHWFARVCKQPQILLNETKLMKTL